MEKKSENPPETKSPENRENSGERKLSVKLKFTKIEETVVDKDPTEAKSDDHVHVCEVCKRKFSSGKALGGHMRVHAQENWGDLIKMNKNSINSSSKKSQHLEYLSRNPSCSICGKNFPSLKSLCGHMRCHPERDYRGIQPPQTGHSSSSSVCDEREPTNIISDLEMTLPCWLTKAKRGRQSLIPDSSSSSSDEDREVAYELMMLAQGESISSGLTTRHTIEASNSDSTNIRAQFGFKDQVFESKTQIIEDLGYGSKCKKLKINETVRLEAKGKALFESSENSLLGDQDKFEGKHSDGSISSDQLITSTVRVKKFTKKKPKYRNLESIDNGDEENNDHNVDEKGAMAEYKCSTCNKCFPSHQALGGHRSSHNKSKMTNLSLARLDHGVALAPKFEDNTKESNTNNVPTYQCSICRKIFPTGQALGGHKRCHWAGTTEEPVLSHATSSRVEEAGHMLLGFDLNELPSMEDDDGGLNDNA